MKSIQDFFIRAKHWQIFLAFIFLGTATAFVPPDEEGKTLAVIGVATYIFMLLFIGWLWAMGSFLNSLSPHKLQLRTGFFKFASLYPLFYLPIFLVSFALSFKDNPSNVVFIIPLHFFAVFCMFYLLYFVSKSLVLTETGKSASFYDYAGPFFLLWFFPIGVWVTQPRINRLFETRMNETPTAG